MLYFSSAFYLIFAWLLHYFGVGISISILVFIFGLLTILLLDSSNATQLMWCVGFFSFFVQPIVLIPPLAQTLNFDMVIVVCFCSISFLIVTRKCLHDSQSLPNVRFPVLQFVSSCASLFALLTFFDLNTSVLMPLILIHLFYVLPAANFYKGVFLLGTFLSLMLVYAIYFWSGFGRLNIASWLIIAFWLFWQRYSLPYAKFAILIPVFYGPSLLGYFRGGLSFVQQYQLGQTDSNLSPIIQANDYAETNRLLDPLALVDQFTIYFLAFVPRTFWDDKPMGFGFEAVLRDSTQALIDVGHTIAALFVGEHLYFLGQIGLISVFFAVFLVAWTCRLSCEFLSDAPYIHLVVLLNVPTFVWGGLSAYSQRVWLGSILLIFLFIFRKLLVRLMKFRSFAIKQ